MKGALNSLTIKGFKSIKELKDFKLNNLNIVIGANGAGKSNFIQVFRMLMAMTKKNLGDFILRGGGADNFLFDGPKETPEIFVEFEFESLSENSKGSNYYKFHMNPTVDETFLIREYRKYCDYTWWSYGSPSKESRLYDERNERSADGQWNGVGHFVYEAISSWMVYHFHDTSPSSPMRRSGSIEDCYKLRGDASNIGSFLLRLKDEYEYDYDEIVNTIKVVMPFFEDFRLDVKQMGEEEKVKLSWRQVGSDYPMQPYHLSDGSIRFICLATALLQPNPPKTIIIDEPELGLHPAAISVLGELIQTASSRTQVIVATQSPLLIDQFSIDDVIVVNRKNGISTFERLNERDFSEWLEDYSIGELWAKDVISGGPKYE